MARGIIGGFTDDTFRGSQYITRQQANSILGLYLSEEEKEITGHIQGEKGLYPSLAAWYLAEGADLLVPFADEGDIAAVHRQTTAYLIAHGVIKGTPVGTAKYLKPLSNLTRAQAAVMIVRVKEVAFLNPADLHLSVTGIPSPVAAGAASSVVVTVRDEDGLVVTDYGGPSSSASTDLRPSCPSTTLSHPRMPGPVPSRAV